MKRRLVIIGAGGFAREVRWLARETGDFEFVGYVVSHPERLGPNDSVAEVLGALSWLTENRSAWDALALGIGTPAARLRIAAELNEFGDDVWPAIVHPSVMFDRESTRIGHGSLVCAGTVATVNVRIEPFALINLSCTLGHESTIGRGSVLNPTVNISGGVQVGEGVLIGTGAQVLQYVSIGASSTVGAGAVVVKDVGPNETVVGVPARPMKAKS